jgi:hypothetical protein
VALAAFSDDYDLAIVVDVDIVLGEKGDVVIIAELANRHELARFEAVKNVANFCLR